MSKKTTLLLFVSYFTVFASVANASDLGYKTGELLVRFAPKPDGKQRTLAEQNDILFSVDCGNVKHSYKLVPGLTVVKLPPGKTVGEALTIFKKSGGILYAEPNYRLKAISTFPNDPNFGQLWGMHNIGQTGGTEDADIEEILKWLEELWLTDEEVRKIISEDEWLKFIESVKDAI